MDVNQLKDILFKEKTIFISQSKRQNDVSNYL